MKQKAVPVKQLAEDVIRDIRRETRRRFSAEEKIRIILDDPRGAESIIGCCFPFRNDPFSEVFSLRNDPCYDLDAVCHASDPILPHRRKRQR